MKKILIGSLAVVLILAAALGIFVATFDANRYKNQVAKGLADALGSPVRVGGLSLGWRQGGLALEIRKLSIFRDRQTLDKPAVYLEGASVKVRLMPLLQKRIEVLSLVLIQPKLNVVREADGSIRVNGINPPPSHKEAETAVSSSDTAKATSFFVGSIKIQGAEVGFVDRSSAMPLRLAIHRLDIVIKNLSFASPVDFKANMAIFNTTQNFHVEGRVRVSALTGPYVLENFKAGTDLGTFKFREVLESVPALKNAGFREAPIGKLNASIDRLLIEGKGLSDLYSTVNLSAGRVSLQSLRSPFDNLNLDATATENNFQLKNLSADFAHGTISASGISKNYFTAYPQSTVGVQVNRIALTDVLPPAQAHQPQLHGNFSGAFNGEAKGLSWPVIAKTLTGDGEVSLTEGVVVNLNILRSIFDKLSQIPGVAATINNQLPPHYRKALSQRDTELPPLKFPVKIVNGVLTIPNLRIGSEGFELQAAGQISLEGAVNCQATFIMEQELTALIAQNAPQIQYVVDPSGRLTLPVRILGDVQHLRIEPDMDYVLSRVLETKGKELITNALQKALTKDQPASPAAAASGNGTAQQEPSYQNILGKLIQ